MMNSKKVELKTADGKTYTLEFDRDSCAKMSRSVGVNPILCKTVLTRSVSL